MAAFSRAKNRCKTAMSLAHVPQRGRPEHNQDSTILKTIQALGNLEPGTKAPHKGAALSKTN